MEVGQPRAEHLIRFAKQLRKLIFISPDTWRRPKSVYGTKMQSICFFEFVQYSPSLKRELKTRGSKMTHRPVVVGHVWCSCTPHLTRITFIRHCDTPCR